MLDRPTLIKRIDQGEKFTYLCFWGHAVTDPVTKTCLSQWYPAPFEVEGVVYPTAEHWMMAGKARLFGDQDALQRIVVAPDPRAPKPSVERFVASMTKCGRRTVGGLSPKAMYTSSVRTRN